MRADKMYVNLSHAWFLNYGLSSQGTIYDYLFDVKTGKWVMWEALVPDLKIADGTPFHEITVSDPTCAHSLCR